MIGAGWAGLAAAIEATRGGSAVTLFEMAPQLGGRARRVDADGMALDNGQHILIGAYVETLALLRTLGVEASSAFLRTPLRITYPDGLGLHLKPGPPLIAFVAAVMRQTGWTWRDRLALLLTATTWSLTQFQCSPVFTVAALTQALPASVRNELIDPLCVAALNTPSSDASASVFLRVLKDSLFSGPGSADLLLPRVDLSALLADPAAAWLAKSGAHVRLRHRVESLTAQGGAWSIDGEHFDHVVLATTSSEAARLSADIAPTWSATARQLGYEPIVTVYLRSEGTRLPAPMLALRSDDHSPAQFVFDRGQLGGSEGVLAFVISGARDWVDRGMRATVQATIEQAQATLAPLLREPLQLVISVIEKRATFRCTPDLARPAMKIAPGLHAAGDYIEGPYPATLEGAVRSGLQAVQAFP